MIQDYSTYRVLQEFFDFPRKNFQIREISRNIKLAQISVMNHLNKLIKEGLIVKEKKGAYPSYKANIDSDDFKLFKRQNMVLLINKSKLLNYVEEKVRPDCLVIFGSSVRGEDTENSDVDLFIQAKERDLDLRKYEKILKRKINLFFEQDIKKLSDELINNLVNGMVLCGYMKVL